MKTVLHQWKASVELLPLDLLIRVTPLMLHIVWFNEHRNSWFIELSMLFCASVSLSAVYKVSLSLKSSHLLHVVKCYLISAAVTERHDFVIWSFVWCNRCKPLQNLHESDLQQRVGVGWDQFMSPLWLCWTSLQQTVSLQLISITLPSRWRRECEVVGCVDAERRRMFFHSSQTIKRSQRRN